MKLVRYVFVGGAAAAVDIGFFTIAVKTLHYDWFFVAILSFVLATAINYLLSVRYVFESGVRFKWGVELSLVFLVSGVGLLANQTVLWFFIEAEKFDEVFAKMMATSTVFLWNYTARSRFIFRVLR